LPRSFLARASTIEELRGAHVEPPSASEIADAAADLARFPIVGESAAYARFLREAGISRDELLQLLAVRTVRSELPAAPWRDVLGTMLQADFLDRCDRNIVGSEGLCKPLYPLLGWCALQIDEWETEFAAEWPSLRCSLLQEVSRLLFASAYKTLVLEANIATLQGVHADVAARPSSVRRFYLRYAALSRLLATIVVQWCDNTRELLLRLARDRSRIEADIIGGSTGLPIRIESSDSDPHDGGKRVHIVHFAGGANVVYKPRSMAVDAAFSELVDWTNRFAVVPPLRTTRVVTGDGYGWAEFIEAKPLPNHADAHAFYERQGAYVALLYITKSTDFHSENVIASGAHPMLIDLETLMHADARLPEEGWSQSCGAEQLSDSVLACGLLPGWAQVDMLGQSPDLSGIGAREGQYYRDPSEFVEYDAAGNLQILRRPTRVPDRPNRPSYDGAPLNPAAYASDVVRGFERVYRVLQREAGTLCAGDGPLAALMEVRTRNVTLATVAYAGLIGRATHPDFATRSVHRELIVADIARRSDALPAAEVLLGAELAALFRGDVPKFTGTARSTSLCDAQGRTATSFLSESAHDAIARRIAGLSDADCALQAGIVGLAMATLRRAGEEGTGPAPSFALPAQPADPSEIVRTVQRIAREICAEAIVRGGRIDWIALVQGDEERSRISEVGLALYGGVTGIGVFLAAVAAQFADTEARVAAERCAARGLDALENGRGLVGGGYIGRSSMAYALLHIATRLQRPDLLDRVLALLPQMAEGAAPDPFYDIIAGSAGRIGVLLAAHAVRPDAALLAAAVAAGEHLVATRVACTVGCGWPPRGASAPLTGFSHGAGGIGWALMALGTRAGRDDLCSAGRDALAYEHAQYSPELQSWPDLRDIAASDAGRAGGSLAWCHGSPGIGLARATLPESALTDDDVTDLDIAIAKLLATEQAPADCLCHGELGNIELLISAAQRFARPDLLHAARLRATGALRRAEERGRWRCGAIPDESLPGLMCGMAGIGYGLLRAAFPDETPAVLTLAPPASGASSASLRSR
jgi:type 2 lantibiotic biosynthesis protein LanM